MTETVIGRFASLPEALEAVQRLQAGGVAESEISILGPSSDAGDPASPAAADKAGAVGAGAGALAGGVGGLLAGLGLIAIPGVGPLIGAGWLAATFSGALVGGVAGGTSGSLAALFLDAGLSKADAEANEACLARGGAVVVVRADERLAHVAEAVLAGHAQSGRDGGGSGSPGAAHASAFR